MGEPPAQSKAVPAETPVRDAGGAEAAETGPGSSLSSSGCRGHASSPGWASHGRAPLRLHPEGPEGALRSQSSSRPCPGRGH